MVERQVDDTKMVAPAPGHHGGDAIDGATRNINLRISGKRRAGEFGMGMAKKNGINADNLCQPRHRVFAKLPDFPLFKSGMRDHDDQLRTFRPHLRHVFPGHLDHIAHHHTAFQIGLVPLHDLRRHQADHPDFQCVKLTLRVPELPLKQHIRRKSVFSTGAVFFAVVHIDVGVDIRKIGALDCAAQERQAEVELVVAQIGGVIAQLVHHFVGRMHLSVLQRPDLGHYITQWIALQQVAVVEQQAVEHLGTRSLDQRDRPGQAVLVGCLVLVVVVTEQIHVYIGGLHDAQLHLRCPRGADREQSQNTHANQHLAHVDLLVPKLPHAITA